MRAMFLVQRKKSKEQFNSHLAMLFIPCKRILIKCHLAQLPVLPQRTAAGGGQRLWLDGHEARTLGRDVVRQWTCTVLRP